MFSNLRDLADKSVEVKLPGLVNNTPREVWDKLTPRERVELMIQDYLEIGDAHSAELCRKRLEAQKCLNL